MSTYPGESPPPPHHEPDDGTEPTQPVGRWEQQSPPQSVPQPPPAYGAQPAASPPTSPLPYGAQGAVPGGYGAPPPYAAYAAPGPDHPRSTLAMVLGIVGLAGGFACGLPLLVSPFAWGLGRGAVKEIRASQGRVGGHGQAMAGMVLGIIGTVLLVLGLIALVLFIVLLATTESSGTGGSTI